MNSIRQFLPIIMLTISNIFMTFAWYGHLRFKGTALWIVILVSWGIAFVEYCFKYLQTESVPNTLPQHN